MTASNKGFTLLEIMVSLAVLAIVLATLFRLQSSTVGLAEAGHFKSAAPLLARQLIAGMAEINYDPDDTSGEFTGEFQGYTWVCELESAGDHGGMEEFLSEDRAEQLKKISLDIYSPGRERRFTIETWRFADAEK
ncbi:MAG: prepilin-type N-terminal cleavage/methylation domain-containing protein [Desulfobacter sp.]|nr:MAG: prepilin-type N-terminal cleavage/methylation domain-containing protein [Desulfobacter sp.]